MNGGPEAQPAVTSTAIEGSISIRSNCMSIVLPPEVLDRRCAASRRAAGRLRRASMLQGPTNFSLLALRGRFDARALSSCFPHRIPSRLGDLDLIGMPQNG